jgi:hypothetical protein
VTDAHAEHDPAESTPSATIGFAHASEAEMARILDFYAVRWEYEPHTFPILWNLDGDVTESFSPDFWLPDLELYLEMTTLRQRLVRKKNRKLRRLRELYPDIRIKLFYARDFRALMLKYGKLALVEGLSGTPGQVLPVRPVESDGAAALGEPAAAATVLLAADAPAGSVPSAGDLASGDASPAASTGRARTAARRRRRRSAAAARRESAR